LDSLGRALLALGAAVALIGVILLTMAKLGISRLPGDILWKSGRFTFYAPLGLMLILSIVLTIALNLFARR
jgi:hypothetical protein